MYDDAGFANQQTSVLPGSSGLGAAWDDEDDSTPLTDEPTRRGPQWHSGLDIGLLVLRVAIGAFFMAHGAQKLFGWFDGPGMDGAEQYIASLGFTEPGILVWVTALSETIGGALLVVGLFTPAGAAMVLGVVVNAIVVKFARADFLAGVELELVYAVAAFALMFTGPGRFALDRHTHWWRKAPVYGFVFLILTAGASVVTLVVLR